MTTQDLRVSPLYAGMVVTTVVSGICALAALAAGSPLQFGVALALFGAGWIAADFIQRTLDPGQQRFTRRCDVTVARPVPAYRPSRVVYAGHCEHFSRPAPPVVSKFAA
ncbi:hypothetical protein U8D42_06075 [Mycobacterium europaeum]|uniref:hypothetical protein n=1 Tax=Mycobacterium europaeum TaxID=761804 RepID=UPI002ADFB9EC|nr:hypothetical protein [Mycobacterium europaeum]MEA1158876.1 hypothetical protein [Mycobacterium europaeum]